MQTLGPPDTFFLSAAIGWYELGNLAEAKAELEQIAPAQQDHPDVLEAGWLIHARRQDWARALVIAERLVNVAPRRATGWLHRAYALRRHQDGSLQAAWDALLPAYPEFPKEPTIAYNLACYACQLNHLEEARQWFARAMRAGGKDKVKSMALNDPDLKSIWPEIRAL
jgi:tetratricopeptide (TPR) repeat protein